VKKPTKEELEAYAKEIGYDGFDAELFLLHYRSVGWYVGTAKMVNWKNTVQTWKRNEPRFGRRQTAAKPKLPYRMRETRINALNRRKAALMREPQTKEVRRELAQIQIQLTKL
jgi:hypothetical protein